MGHKDPLSDERATPQFLYDELDAEFHFDCDIASAWDNYKHPNHYSLPHINAFGEDWVGANFCNPPYSNIAPWLKYGREQVEKHNSMIVFILPSDTSTKWFHNWIWDKTKHQPRPGIQIRHPDRRYAFGDNIQGAKFSNSIVVMRKA